MGGGFVSVQLPKTLEAALTAFVADRRFESVEQALNSAVVLLIKHQAPLEGLPAEEAYIHHLVRSGSISRLPLLLDDEECDDDELIEVDGEPLSETIIRERG